MANKRIVALNESLVVKSDMYIATDHDDDGTKKVALSTLIDSSLTGQGKAADAKKTGEEINSLKELSIKGVEGTVLIIGEEEEDNAG